MYQIENANDLFEGVKHLMDASSCLKSSRLNLSNAVLEAADNLLKEIEDTKIECDEERILKFKEEILKKKSPAIEVFENDYQHILERNGRPKGYSLEFTTTEACNYNCEYCFEHGTDRTKTLDSSKIDIIIEKVKEFIDGDWFRDNLDTFKIDFWGGEPFLNPFPVTRLLETFMEDERISFHAYTNGSKIDPLLDLFEKASKISDDKIVIQFSYDGQPIHDMRRVDKAGNPTGEFTLKQARKTADRGIPINFKSTIMIKDFQYLSEVWDDYRKSIYYPFKDSAEISFAPTIDYTQDYNETDLRPDVLQEQILDIASKEVDFFKEENRFLLSWFSTRSVKLCGAAKSMTCVDADGELYFCHGCMYEDSKDQLSFGNIYESGFANKLIANYYRFFDCNSNLALPEECNHCIGNSCYKCNIQKLRNSKKDSFMEKWTDFRCMEGMCDYFKLIGEIKQALEMSIGG
jgi:radical SAM protein with 4Fe4S-binding SPASM domain